MNTQIVRSLSVEQWQTFVDQHPKGNVFHTPEMFNVFSRTKGYDPELWAALQDGQVMALFLPVHISLRGSFLHHLTTRTVVFGGILNRTGTYGEIAAKHLLHEYKRISGSHSLFTELRNISPLGDVSTVMLEEGFIYEDHLNYLINLERPVEEIFEGIGKRTRKNIKNGLNKARVIVEEAGDRSEIASCYRLLDMTYRGAHVPLADASLFEAAFDILSPKKMVRFTLAKVDEQAAAVSIELLYKDTLFGWYGGLDRAFASFVPNELLMWHILKWGAEQGFKKYDFGGAGKPNEKYGVRDFKAKFGGDLVCYGRNTWVPHPKLMSISKFAYQVIRRTAF